jgi:hypothetical protein
MKSAILAAALLAAVPAAAADNQLRPFLGGTFGGSTTFVDPDRAAGKLKPAIGVTFVTLRNIFGLDVDIANTPGFFESGEKESLVLSSRVTTLTGNIVVAAPRTRTEYGIRPSVVGGAGLWGVRLNYYFGSSDAPRTLPAFDVGAGALAFFTNRVGIDWEVRRFQTLSRDTAERGLTIGKEQLSFWRASMGLVYRY